MTDLMMKATSKPAWDAFATASGLTDENGPLGCYIDEIGTIVTSPAIVGDYDGSIITPAVMDAHHHVNVRLTSPEHDPAVIAAGGPGVEWVDSATVDNPRRIWAGGMNYFRPTE